MNAKFDDEVCYCGHSKGYHGETSIDKHGGKCEKCDCKLYTWKEFVKYTPLTANLKGLDEDLTGDSK